MGCLLLAKHSQDDWELVYFGLAPAARGFGYGRQVVQFAKSCVANHQGRQLLLAVDVQNDPAIRIYQQEGFYPIRRKVVWTQQLNA